MNQRVKGHTGDFIKRQAKKIAKEENIAHHDALDKAAVHAGFQNWNHFINSSNKTSSNNPKINIPEIKVSILPEQKNELKVKKTNPYRNLITAAINELIKAELITLAGKSSDAPDRENDGHCFADLFGFPSVILWQDIGFDELRISVWWKYVHEKHPQANLTGNRKERFSMSSPLADKSKFKNFVGVVASAWLERKNGKYIQGKNNKAIFDVYTRKGEKSKLENLPIQTPEGFKTEGKFHF